MRPCIFNLVFQENVMIQKYEENVNTKIMNYFKIFNNRCGTEAVAEKAISKIIMKYKIGFFLCSSGSCLLASLSISVLWLHITVTFTLYKFYKLFQEGVTPNCLSNKSA